MHGEKRSSILLCEVFKMWLSSNKIRIKQSTFDKYNYIIDNHINPFLGDIPVVSIDTVTLNEFLYNKLNSGELKSGKSLSPSYVRTMALIINSSLRFAANEGYCNGLKNPIYKPSINTKNVLVFKQEDSLKLTNHIFASTDGTGLGILLALYMGLRIGEICALKWDNIDFKQRTILIDSTVTRVKDLSQTKYLLGTPKTKSSTRIIPIPKKIFSIIKQEFLATSSAYVISSTNSFVIPRTFEYRYHKLLEELEIESVNFHTLRHTFATNCISSGMDAKSLSEILGHANISTTLQLYVHPSLDMKRRQLNKVFQ